VPPSVYVAYYSRTGTTRTLAERVASRLASPAVDRIRPTVERSYPNWLGRSLLPGSTVPIEPIRTDLRAYDAVVLGTPKWSLSCPPVTEYLQRVALDGVPTGVVLTYGGFDEQRYLRGLVSTLRDAGADVRATLRVQRDAVGGRECAAGVDRFCRALRPPGDR
jgi:hypothetical protein